MSNGAESGPYVVGDSEVLKLSEAPATIVQSNTWMDAGQGLVSANADKAIMKRTNTDHDIFMPSPLRKLISNRH